jgi:DDE superfamily endonuclease/Transposase
MKHYLSWKEKKAIVDEAYCSEKNIKATARKYNVSPAQIRRWKAKLADILPVDDNGITDGRKRHIMNLKMVQNGRPRKDSDKYDELKAYFENIRSMDRVVTVGMLCFELKRLKPTLDIDLRILRKRIYRWLSSEHIVQRRVTHVAQNTRYDSSVIEQFVTFVNGQIATGSFSPDSVVNIDETNIEFDMTGSVTLANQGSRTVSLRSSGSSARCTVLLGVTFSGKKLPPFVIFKGMPNGRIAREWTGSTDFPSTSIYAVQQKAWIDERTFLEWIRKVWGPFCAGKSSTYLLMDECTVHLMSSCLNAIQDYGMESLNRTKSSKLTCSPQQS